MALIQIQGGTCCFGVSVSIWEVCVRRGGGLDVVFLGGPSNQIGISGSRMKGVVSLIVLSVVSFSRPSSKLGGGRGEEAQ
jgi:hypothetical protein